MVNDLRFCERFAASTAALCKQTDLTEYRIASRWRTVPQIATTSAERES